MKNKYRKTDQEYVDSYDRYTIKRLKELEKESKTPLYYNKDLEDLTDSGGSTTWVWDDPTSKYIPSTLFFTTAVQQAQNKENSILLSKRADENRDRLIMETPVPKNIRCNKCSSEMNHEGHIFKEEDTLLLFVFSCPNKHSPKKAVYPGGKREWIFEKSTCEKCGGELNSKTEENEAQLIFTDTCISCGNISIMELDVPEPDSPINEEERKKYCTDWKGKKTFVQSLEEISDFMKHIKQNEAEKKVKEDYQVDKIEKVNVPKLEVMLSKVSEELGFIKFKFDNTSTKGFVIVSFSAQDPSDRKERVSIKELTIGIKKTLHPTNWRLMSDEIDYRLGVLSGRLKAFEDDEGLLKIAKEIYENKKNEVK